MDSSSTGGQQSAAKIKFLINTAVIAVSVIFLLSSLIAVWLRFKARRISKQGSQADDWTLLVAWIFSLGASIWVWVFASLTGVNYLKGDPSFALSKTIECLQIASAIWQFPLTAIKLSVLLFYRRVFKTTRAVVVAILIPIILAWGILFFFLVLLPIDPIEGAWTGGGVFRYNANAVGLAQCGSSLALDVFILCLPIPVILKLHMPKNRKWAVIGIFWLGAFCVVAAAVRLAFLNENTQRVINSGPEGFTLVYIQWNTFVFAFLEINCSIIAACLPCYGHLFTGGRGPGSMIASFRSMFSLRSRRSLSSGNVSGLRATDDHTRLGSVEAGFKKPFTEATVSTPDHASNSSHELNIINVTRQFDVTRD